MTDLKGYEGGEGFDVLSATIRFIGEPRKTSAGKVQDAMLVGEDGGTLGFALWLADYPGIGDGDTVELTNGWVTEGEYKPFKGKLIVRLKKDATVTVTAKETAAPALLSAQVQAAFDTANGEAEKAERENHERDKMFARRDCLKTVALFYKGQGPRGGEGAADFLITIARDLYQWAMYGDEENGPPSKEPPSGDEDEEDVFKDLMDDANAALAERGFEPHYKHANHIKNALKQEGYTGYKPSKHGEYVAKLVARVERKAINEDKSVEEQIEELYGE